MTMIEGAGGCLMKHFDKKTVVIMLLFIAIILALTFLTSDVAWATKLDTSEGSAFQKAWKVLIEEYRVIIAAVSGIGALTAILVFIVHMIQLAGMPHHPILRRQVLTGLLISAICTALLGGISLIMTLFYGIVFNY